MFALIVLITAWVLFAAAVVGVLRYMDYREDRKYRLAYKLAPYTIGYKTPLGFANATKQYYRTLNH